MSQKFKGEVMPGNRVKLMTLDELTSGVGVKREVVRTWPWGIPKFTGWENKTHSPYFLFFHSP